MAEEDRGFWGNLFGRRDDAPRDIPVDFFSLPMDANPEKDEVVGEGDFGPVYQTVRGQRYQIRPTSTERSYESEPGTLDRVAEVGRGAIEDTIDGTISGVTAPARAARGEDMTYGDAFETAGTAQAGGAGFAAPEGSLRTFVAGTSPREGFSPAGETTLDALRRNYPDAEARGEAYQAYERPNRGGMDIEVYPEREMTRTPYRPGDPSRGDFLYDPDRAVVRNEPDYVDVDGESIDISYSRAEPLEGARRLSEIVEPQDGVIYRGMSAEEYQNAMRDGYFESRGDYNIGEGQRGLTFFSPNMDTAENYAASFTPFDYLPTPDRPAYVVAIRQPEDVNLDTQGEVGVPGRIPVSEIVDTYRGDVYAARPSDWHLQDDWGTPRLSGVRYTPQISWSRMDAPEPLPAAQPQEFNRGGLVLSDATKGIATREGMEMANKKFQLDRSKADQDGDGDVSKLEEIQGEAAQRTVGKDDLVEMACGGIMMPDMEYDPVSGNEVPLGSTPENVRDDIPAMLSQDEYVLPAHVVKWHGLKHIQEMQMEAEAGLMSMSMEGLIGGVEEAAEEADEDDTMEDEYVEDMDVEVDVPTVEVEDELEGEEYEEEPQTSTLPGMMKKQKYAFIIS